MELTSNKKIFILCCRRLQSANLTICCNFFCRSYFARFLVSLSLSVYLHIALTRGCRLFRDGVMQVVAAYFQGEGGGGGGRGMKNDTKYPDENLMIFPWYIIFILRDRLWFSEKWSNWRTDKQMDGKVDIDRWINRRTEK